MRTLRKFWGLVGTPRWKVINPATGRIIGSYWSRGAAQNHSSDLNEALQYIGSKNTYEVRWM